MFENIENLKLLSVYEGISATNAVFVNKPSHFILYKLYGESEYYFGDGERMKIGAGKVLFIPKGSDYSVKKLSEGESRYIAVRFEADGIENTGLLYNCIPEEAVNLEDIFRTMNSLWLFRTSAKKHRCYSVFYGLLAAFSDNDSHRYVGHGARQILTDAVNYLESHIFDKDLSVENLISRSGVSGTYFRKCFANVYGLSPKEYICEKRLLHARNILDGGDYGSIADVARSVGFDDALYFGKVFKKKYGVSPSGYIG